MSHYDTDVLLYSSVEDALEDNGWSVNAKYAGYPKATTKDGYEIYFPRTGHFELTTKPEGSDARKQVFSYENNAPISPKYIAVLEYVAANVEEAVSEWGPVIINGEDN